MLETSQVLNHSYPHAGVSNNKKKPDDSVVKGQVIVDLEIERKAPVAIDAVADELTLMHKELYNAFLWSISDNYVNLLNQCEEVQA